LQKKSQGQPWLSQERKRRKVELVVKARDLLNAGERKRRRIGACFKKGRRKESADLSQEKTGEKDMVFALWARRRGEKRGNEKKASCTASFLKEVHGIK